MTRIEMAAARAYTNPMIASCGIFPSLNLETEKIAAPINVKPSENP
ncbi:hypothetical protein BMS3Bbin03_00926 [bacterium BMS3Bbin03]|nr:hypothetical protein BMS3Bbin03_00926 [bacterium BMS3Bbin03]